MNPLDLLNSGPPIQNFILLNGDKSPGLATPVNAGSPRTWDEQKGWGFSGATLIFTGDGLSDVDVIIELWEMAHWPAWDRFARILEKSPIGVKPKALSIVHPLLNRAPLKITQVVILDVSQFEQGTGASAGRWTCRIKFKVFGRPRPALGKPDGSYPQAGTGILDFSKDPQIKELMAKQAALGGVL